MSDFKIVSVLNPTVVLTAGPTISAGTQSQGTGTIVFSNSNGVSFGLNNGTLTASAAGGGAADGYNSAQFTNSTANSTMPILWAGNSNGSGNVTIGLTGSTVTMSAPSGGAGGGATVNGSTGNVSLTVASSLSMSTNGSTISFGLASDITTALQSAGNYLTTAALSEHSHGFSASGGSSTFQTLGFSNANNVTFSNSNGSVVASASFAQSVDTGKAGTGFTSAGTNISFSGTLNTNGLSLQASVAAPGGGGAVNFSAGTTSNNLQSVVFSDSNNISFGLNGSTITGSVVTHGHGINLVGANTAGTTSFTGTLFNLSGGNDITLSGNNNTIVVHGAVGTGVTTAGGDLVATLNSNGLSISHESHVYASGWSIVGNTAGTNSTGFTNDFNLVLSGGPNITLSGSSNTIVVSAAAPGGGAGVTVSNFAWPYDVFAGVATGGGPIGQFGTIGSFRVPNNISFSFLEQMWSMGLTSSSTASTANTTLSYGLSETNSFVLYTRGTGASSLSLQSIGSTSHSSAYSFFGTYGSASNTQQGVQLGFTYPNSTGTSSISTSFTTSNVSTQVLQNSILSRITGPVLIAFPWASSLTPGDYWIAHHKSSASAASGGAVMSNLRPNPNPYYVTQVNASYHPIGENTASSYHLGMGSISTAGSNTISSVPLTALSSSASHIMPWMLFRVFS